MPTSRIISLGGLVLAMALSLSGCASSASTPQVSTTASDRSAMWQNLHIEVCLTNDTNEIVRYRFPGSPLNAQAEPLRPTYGDLKPGDQTCAFSTEMFAANAEIMKFDLRNVDYSATMSPWVYWSDWLPELNAGINDPKTGRGPVTERLTPTPVKLADPSTTPLYILWASATTWPEPVGSWGVMKSTISIRKP